MITTVNKMKVEMKLQDKVYYQVLMTQDFGKFELRKTKKELLLLLYLTKVFTIKKLVNLFPFFLQHVVIQLKDIFILKHSKKSMLNKLVKV
jgi:hypothetical protein